MQRCILAFDFAKTCGFACWREDWPKPIKGIVPLHFDSIGHRLAVAYRWGIKQVKAWGVTDIVFEAPVIGGGKEDKIIWLVGGYAVFLMLGHQLGVSVSKVRNESFFVFWCGTNNIEGDQRKVYSVLEAHRRGFPEIDMKQHDVADAVGVLTFRCAELGLKVPWDGQRSPGPLFTGIQTGHNKPQGVAIDKSNKVAAAKILNRMSFDRPERET